MTSKETCTKTSSSYRQPPGRPGVHSRRAESPTDRQERLDGWRQERLHKARVLILGAGALGNENSKNLALMGLGYMLIADFDRISPSNLSRGVFFRKSDAGLRRSKAEAVAARARRLNSAPHAWAQPFTGDIVWRLGAGVYRRVDVVLGCLDNIEARLDANTKCLLAGVPYIDGGIRGLAGNVTAVNPPDTACWECTLSPEEKLLAGERYDSCSRVMRRDLQAGRLPTVQVASAIIAGFQSQEAVKVIQGYPWGRGTRILYSASGGGVNLDSFSIVRHPDCWCNQVKEIPPLIELSLSCRDSLASLLSALERCGHQPLQVMFPGSLILERRCYACCSADEILKPAFTLDTSVLFCPRCGAQADQVELRQARSWTPECPEEYWSGPVHSRIVEMWLYDLGFAPLAWVPIILSSGRLVHIELSRDAIAIMGGAAFASPRRTPGFATAFQENGG